MRACAKFVAACIVGALVPQGAVLAAELIILTNPVSYTHLTLPTIYSV